MTSYKTVSNTIISNLNVKLLHEERRYNDCRIKKELLGMVLTSYNEKMLNPFKSYSTSVFLPNVVHSHANLIENLYSFFSSCKVLFIAVPAELKPIHNLLFMNNAFHAIQNKH